MKIHCPAFHVASEPGIDLSKHSVDIFYLVAYALVYFTGKICFGNKLNISEGEMLPVPYCNRKIQTVDMNSEIMLQSRQITSFRCPPHLLPVLLDFLTPFLFLRFT